jgi:hypothetical protein
MKPERHSKIVPRGTILKFQSAEIETSKIEAQQLAGGWLNAEC